MDSEAVHQEFLAALLGLRTDARAAQIRIVARLFNDKFLGGSAVAPVFVFVPDLHLMGRDGDDTYQYGFRRIDASRRIDRGTLLTALLDALVPVRDALDAELGDGALRLVQLGDFVDLWREDERESEGVQALVDRILVDNQELWTRLGALEAEFIVGNHDDNGPRSATLQEARRALPAKIGDQRSLLITHGHLYDPVEQGLIADLDLNEWFVERFGPVATARPYLVDRTAGGQTAELGGSEGAAPRVLSQLSDGLGLPDWINLWFTVALRDAGGLTRSHELLPNALEFADGIRTGRKKTLNSAGLKTAMPDLRTVVMGHSHFPRICVHRDANDPDQDLVLIDCGAWIETSQFGAGDRPPSCHVGVLCGGDARIYQIDPHPSLFGTWP